MTKTFKSDRNIDLVFSGAASRPILTVELYLKWYQPYIIYPDGHVEGWFDTAERSDLWHRSEPEFISATDCSAAGNHCWHPAFLDGLAQRAGFIFDDAAHEMVAGRWEIEHCHRYDDHKFTDWHRAAT